MDKAKAVGIKTHMKTSFILACFLFTMLASYAYSFFMGGIWIYNEIWNHSLDRDYNAGDILCCFFGVLFGMFSLGMAAPNIKAVAAGMAAGKMIFDIIDRKPTIDS